ncbi:MAG TPA: BON domain-containing protein [Gemmatimonadaceae bacterium]|nr:BON domain-containing protein [Gemmatimonadaceae bacterium]
MSPFRYRDRGPSGSGLAMSVAAGALVGFVAGVFVAQRTGGFAALTAKLRGTLGRPVDEDYDAEEFAEDDDLEGEESFTGATLEERVLEAYMNDPILSERAVDIGEIGTGIIELAGWVETDEEADHAVTVARGVPDVDTVVNRLTVGVEEDVLEENFDRFAEGDSAQAGWEGQQVGTGKRRQGSSKDIDRHADPRTDRSDKWLSENEAMKLAADDTEGLAERRAKAKKSPKGDRTGGSSVSPTGVPKADHVASPLDAPRSPAD